MKSSELVKLIKTSYDVVGRSGNDAARIYHAVVELDGQVRMWKKRATDLGWSETEQPRARTLKDLLEAIAGLIQDPPQGQGNNEWTWKDELAKIWRDHLTVDDTATDE